MTLGFLPFGVEVAAEAWSAGSAARTNAANSVMAQCLRVLCVDLIFSVLVSRFPARRRLQSAILQLARAMRFTFSALRHFVWRLLGSAEGPVGCGLVALTKFCHAKGQGNSSAKVA